MSGQKLFRVVCAAVLSTLLLMPLVACGGSLSGGGEQAAEHKPTNTFEGRETRDAADLEEFKDKATKAGKESKAAVSGKDKDSELATSQQEAFAEANAAYKKGEYAAAEEAYKKVLEEHPTNYGANVNLVLALLQQQRNDEALTQALTCVYLFPTDSGPALNAQVAGVAVGFDIQDVNETVEAISKEQKGKLDLTSKRNKNADDLTYNLLWDRIDTELHDEATGSGESSSSEKKATKSDYDQLCEELADLLDKRPDDEDVLALVEYFEGAAKKLGHDSTGLVSKDKQAAEDEKAEEKAAEEARNGSSSSSKKDSSSSSSSKSNSSSSSSRSTSSSSSSKK